MFGGVVMFHDGMSWLNDWVGVTTGAVQRDHDQRSPKYLIWPFGVDIRKEPPAIRTPSWRPARKYASVLNWLNRCCGAGATAAAASRACSGVGESVSSAPTRARASEPTASAWRRTGEDRWGSTRPQ